MTKQTNFAFSALLDAVHALGPKSQNLAFRTISTSALASWTNRTTNEVIGESVRKNDAAILENARLAGCENLKLITELEEQENSGQDMAVPLATLPTEKAFVIHRVASALAKETATIGNRYEQPMTLAQWLKFLIQNTQRDNAAALAEFAEVSGHDIQTVSMMDQQMKKMELERLDRAIPSLIQQYQIDSELLKGDEDVDLDIFNYFKLLLKMLLKLEKEAMAATNRAIRFTNLQFLDDARQYKQDAAALQVVIDQFQLDYEEELAIWEQQIQNLRMAA